MALEMRAIQPSGQPAAALLVVSAFTSAYRELLTQEALARMTPEHLLSSWSAAADLKLIGGYLDETLVGVARIGADPESEDAKTGHLYSLYIAPTHHSHGLGRLLLESTVAKLSDLGFTTATLWVFEANTRARLLYEKKWKPTGLTRVEPEWEIPEIQLACQLSRP